MSNTVRRSLLMSAGQSYAQLAINFLTLVVASRLLTPAEIGIAALGIAATSMGEAMRDFGASNYIVQREEITATSVRTAFTVTFLVSSVIGLLIIAGAGVMAGFYGEPRLVNVLRLIGLAFIIFPFSGTLMALMSRDMQFSRIAAIAVTSQGAGAIATLALASSGYSYLSFALGALLAVVLAVVLALAMRPEFWIFKPCLKEWREVLAFGGLSSASMMIDRAFFVLPALALGRFAPMADVGIYSRARSICQLSDRLVLAAVWSVALSALAQAKRDGRSLKEAYLNGLGYVTGLFWPINVMLVLLAHPAVAVLLGSQWTSVVPLVQIMAISMLFAFPAVLGYPILVASGGVADALRVQVLAFIPNAIIVIVAARHGATALAASQLVTTPILIGISLYYIKKRVAFGWGEFLTAVRPSAIVTASAMAAPVALVLAVGGGGLNVGVPVAVAAGLLGLGGWLGGIYLTDHLLRNEIDLVVRAVRGRVWARST